MTTPEPTAEHIDAVARVIDPFAFDWPDEVITWRTRQESARTSARAILTTDDPDEWDALAANLPREVMLAALVADGTLKEQAAPLMRDGDSWRPRWDGNHTHEGTRLVTAWEAQP